MSAKDEAGSRSTGKAKRRGTPRPGCGGARPGSGPKPKVFTPKQKKHVEILIASGIPIKDIAAVMGCDDKTLRLKCPDALALGKTRRIGAVANALFENAVRHNNLSAQIFIMKAQGGWRETHHLEHSGNVTLAQLVAGSMESKPHG